MKFTEEELLDGIRNNDDKALSALYKLHYPMIVHFIVANNGTEQEAKDVYQEAFVAFYQKVRSDQHFLHVKVKTYIYSVCRNLWLKRLLHKRKYLVQLKDFEEPIGLHEDMPVIEDSESRFQYMALSLSELGEPCKTLIEDFYINGNSMQDIVSKFRYTNTDNAKNQKYKCLQRLKKLFFSKYTKVEG